MVITLIVIAMLFVGIICLTSDNIDWFPIGGVLICAGFVGLLITGAFIIDANINRDVKYQNALYEKEMLEYRIDNMSENIVGNEMLYNDIVEFNNELRSTKKWANNPWTNWFHNPDIATIDYIEFNHL